MTGPESTPVGHEDRIAALLADAGIGMGPVSRMIRLIGDSPALQSRVREFYSSLVGGRLIAMDNSGADGQTYAAMRQHNLPVLEQYDETVPGVDLLRVPHGAWSLGSRLHIFPRNFSEYSGMLAMVAQVQREQYDAGLGVLVPAEGARLIDHFAFVPDMSSPTGQRLYMIPPYDTIPYATPQDFAGHFLHELATARHGDGRPIFEPAQMEYLNSVITQGAAGDGQP